MRGEERSQPLEDGTILEYIVHGKFAFKETDTNDTCGAWWMSLRRMVMEVGKEVVGWRTLTTRSSSFGRR